MSTLQSQVKKALEQRQTKRRVVKHLKELDARLGVAYKNLDELHKVLEEETEDYEKLEKLSLKGLFHKVLGSKEQQMEKEKQEYLHASLKYDEKKKEIDLMEYERKILEEKLSKLDGVEKRAEELLKKRMNELVQSNSSAGKKLRKAFKQIDETHLYRKEIGEAIGQGQKAVHVLNEITGYLQKARNWGQWDMAGRKGRMTSYAKHSNIDAARARIHQAQHLLNDFKYELNDVYKDVESLHLQLNISDFSRFADIFFDNLISDWIIQQKIQNALASVRATHDKVVRITGSLNQLDKEKKAEIKQLEAEKTQIVMNS